jgi:hypothetical protein
MTAHENLPEEGKPPQDAVDMGITTEDSTAPKKAHADEPSNHGAPRSSSSEITSSHQKDDAAAAPDTETGNPLDRVPSQAQKLGKKKIAVVMGALCVCSLWFWFEVLCLDVC